MIVAVVAVATVVDVDGSGSGAGAGGVALTHHPLSAVVVQCPEVPSQSSYHHRLL